jgi:hypothetical protein
MELSADQKRRPTEPKYTDDQTATGPDAAMLRRQIANGKRIMLRERQRRHKTICVNSARYRQAARAPLWATRGS